MSYRAPVKDMLFVIKELADIDTVASLPGFEEAGYDTAAAVLEEAAKFSEGVLAPLNWTGDQEGAVGLGPAGPAGVGVRVDEGAPLAALEDMESEAAAATTADEEADADDVSLHQDAGEDSPYLDEGVEAHAESVSVLASDAADDEPLDDESPNDAAIPDAIITPIERHTVYTARYRLVQKGPERGKWEADVVAEADAPLITVEMVVRGVQRRAGEESEILRYSAAQIARALRIEWPAAAPAVTSPDAAAA